MSVDPPTVAPGASGNAVRIEVTFHTRDERHAQTVASRLIDRAHEIANMPECECDVDVTVESTSTHSVAQQSSSLAPISAPVTAGGAPPRGRPSES